MIGTRNNEEQSYNIEKKKPFTILNNNLLQTCSVNDPVKHEIYSKNEIQDIKMELIEMEDVDDKESSPQGLDQIWQDHETLVNIILQEEEDLLASHRKYIDDVVDWVK